MKNVLIGVITTIALATPAMSSSLTDVYSSYYAFGDSLTDDGKLGFLSAPSLEGRFSNGPTYAEYIEDRFVAAGRDTGNLALGGATAGDVNLAPLGALSTFSGQIDTFKSALAAGFGLPTKLAPVPEFKPTGPAPGANPLVSVLFGANDFFQGQSVIAAANAVADGIRAIGAIASHTFDDFLVLSLPDIGGSPAFAGAGSAAATAATDLFNAQLALNILALEAEGFNIIGFDTMAVVDDILEDIASGGTKYGILDATTPCTVSLSAPGPSCLDLGIDPDTLLFSDAVHPNAVAHRLLGERALVALEDNLAAIPVPASLPLILTAFASLALIRRRRRAAA